MTVDYNKFSDAQRLGSDLTVDRINYYTPTLAKLILEEADNIRNEEGNDAAVKARTFTLCEYGCAGGHNSIPEIDAVQELVSDIPDMKLKVVLNDRS